MALVALGDVSVPEKRAENETPLKARAAETGRVISSPAPTKAHARHIAKGKLSTTAMKSSEAETVTIGLPYLKPRETVHIENIGKKFSGSWQITKVHHKISSSGYTCSMTLNKNDHEGKSSGNRSTPKASTGKATPAKFAGTSKPKTVKVDLNTGKVIE